MKSDHNVSPFTSAFGHSERCRKEILVPKASCTYYQLNVGQTKLVSTPKQIRLFKKIIKLLLGQ